MKKKIENYIEVKNTNEKPIKIGLVKYCILFLVFLIFALLIVDFLNLFDIDSNYCAYYILYCVIGIAIASMFSSKVKKETKVAIIIAILIIIIAMLSYGYIYMIALSDISVSIE